MDYEASVRFPRHCSLRVTTDIGTVPFSRSEESTKLQSVLDRTVQQMILRLHAHLDDTALASEATQTAIGGVEGLRQRGMDYGGGGQNVLIDFYSLFNSSLALAARSAVVYRRLDRTNVGRVIFDLALERELAELYHEESLTELNRDLRTQAPVAPASRYQTGSR